MKRKYAWIAVCVTMASGVAVLAQQPVQAPNVYRNPGMYGFPGNPTLPSMPYPPQPPAPPYDPFPPSWPYANPFSFPAPADPRLPGGQRPSTVPTYNGGGPAPGAAEPYLVSPEPAPSSGPAPTPPESTPGSVVTEPQYPFVPSWQSEPYITYEGPRYMAEMKEDDSRVWAQANYIHWWVRRDSTPPLLTTGDPANRTVGTIGNADTRILVGDGAIGPKEFSGIQATLGIWLDPERLESLEIGGFWLGRNSRQYSFTSDAKGSPPLGQPVIVGGNERSLLLAAPNKLAGNFAVNNAMEFHGLELDHTRNILRINGWTLDTLAGIHYLYLNDFLGLNQNITVLPGGVKFIPFPGVAATPVGTKFRFTDSFDLTNRFYGGTIGARANWAWCRFDIGAVMKVSLGATEHVAVISGATTLNAIGGRSATISGGSLAQASNIGRTTSTDFTAVPEFTATVGYRIAPHLRIVVGYTVFDWNRIERAGNQVDRRINFAQVPTSPSFVPGTTAGPPFFPAARTDFWAQGINVGLELKY